MRARPSGLAERGFTLIETVVAFAILALFLGAMLPSLSSGLSGSRAGSDTLRATAYAQSLLDGAGIGGGLEPGEFRNTLEDERFTSVLAVRPYGGAPVAGKGPALFEVSATVTWRDGTKTRSVALTTLRYGVAN